jgi:hypothetical protein
MQRLRNCVVLLMLFAVLAQGCSSSSTNTVIGVSATGTVHCRNVMGAVVFTPPITLAGATPETIEITAHLSHCSTSGSNVAVISSGVATATITGLPSACSGLLRLPSSSGSISAFSSSMPITVNVNWDPPSIKPSVVRFSGFAASLDAAGKVGFAFPGVGHSAGLIGSFAGNDTGALSTALAYTTEEATQILTGCSQPSGVASITLSSGEFTVG